MGAGKLVLSSLQGTETIRDPRLGHGLVSIQQLGTSVLPCPVNPVLPGSTSQLGDEKIKASSDQAPKTENRSLEGFWAGRGLKRTRSLPEGRPFAQTAVCTR